MMLYYVHVRGISPELHFTNQSYESGQVLYEGSEALKGNVAFCVTLRWLEHLLLRYCSINLGRKCKL